MSASASLHDGDPVKAVALSYVTSKASLLWNRALHIHYLKLLFLPPL